MHCSFTSLIGAKIFGCTFSSYLTTGGALIGGRATFFEQSQLDWRYFVIESRGLCLLNSTFCSYYKSLEVITIGVLTGLLGYMLNSKTPLCLTLTVFCFDSDAGPLSRLRPMDCIFSIFTIFSGGGFTQGFRISAFCDKDCVSTEPNNPLSD